MQIMSKQIEFFFSLKQILLLRAQNLKGKYYTGRYFRYKIKLSTPKEIIRFIQNFTSHLIQIRQ